MKINITRNPICISNVRTNISIWPFIGLQKQGKNLHMNEYQKITTINIGQNIKI